MEYPFIEFEGRKFYQVGCAKCRQAFGWLVFHDGATLIFKCKLCGSIGNPKKMETLS